MNRSEIVFVYARDLWKVPRAGGAAIRLTTGQGIETRPYFSPDGSMIAFTGEYDGNVDVFVMPAAGGVPKRITYHPGTDLAVGWSADGKQILFVSDRQAFAFVPSLFEVSPEGGNPEKLPLPMAAGGAFSPDGTEIAYMPLSRADRIWKRYRGGRATPIWIAKLSDSSVTPIPRKDSNDYDPMWIGDDVYFLSDRNNGKVNLFRYSTKSKQVAQVFEHGGLDIKAATAGPGGIVYEQFGAIHIYDLKTGRTSPVDITLNGDLAEVRPRMEKVSKFIQDAQISPTGARAVFSARGDVFTVPAEKGNARNLTGTPGIAERDPSWSPDGKWVAYFSDESGEYELYLTPQMGVGETQKLSLGMPPSFFYSPTWSPDSKKIAYYDKRLQLWYIDIEKKTPVKIDTTTFQGSEQLLRPRWSPDSKWIAYNKQLPNHLCAVNLYSIESAKSTEITDGMSDARYAEFDKNGKYLYLAASTDVGPRTGGLDMSSTNRLVTRNVYAVVLSKDEPSPVAPESDEEKVADDKKPDEKKDDKKDDKKGEDKIPPVKIDFEGIAQRTVPLPIPARNWVSLQTGKSGMLYLMERPSVTDLLNRPEKPQTVLHRFDIAKRKLEKFGEGMGDFVVSHNGEKLMYTQGPNWFITSATAAIKPNEGRLKMDDLEMQIDPKAEWRQMYKEVLRIERDFFYDPNHHGLDVQALGERYEKYLANLGSRDDLNYLWREMLGELSVGHLYIGGGDSPEEKKIKGGLLGADYKIENGRYRIARVFDGENWNPKTRAPLTQPGVNVKAGDYILAVNGSDVRGTDDLYSFFEGTAGKNVLLKVGADPSGANAREVTVVPLDNENELRRLAWIEGNRRKVDQMTGGKVAYVYLPDTAAGGYTYFNRYYFAQSDRQAIIIDERFNRGGQAADYIIDSLRRPLWNYWTSRDGQIYTTPATAIFGPKVMIVNQYAGSGGDLLPWLFRRANLGPIIGKRTWGGLVGIGGYPDLIDGGSVTAPHFAFFSPDGKWDVENHGTDVDYDVNLDPKAWREGHDTQLEKAVEVVMDLLKKNPPPQPKRPPYPVYHSDTPISSGGGVQ